MDNLLLIISGAILGLLIGSFLNVVISRYPKLLKQRWQTECLLYLKQPVTESKTENLVRPRSHCLHCKKQLKCWHMIPLLSYLLLGAKCAFCKRRISFRYPLIELLTAIVSSIVLLQFQISWHALFALIFSWSLIVLSFIDIDEKILPDTLTITTLWIGLLASALSFFTPAAYAIVGAASGYLSLWVITKLYQLIRKKQGMGEGDFKLFAMIGAWLGSALLLNVLLMSTALAILVTLVLFIFRKQSQKNTFAFGPYLAFSAWLTFIYGPTLMNWIERII